MIALYISYLTTNEKNAFYNIIARSYFPDHLQNKREKSNVIYNEELNIR